MIKVFGLLMIITSTTMAGFIYGDKMKKRVRELSELQRGVLILKNEINFIHSLLPEALNKVAEKCTGSISKIFSTTSQFLENNEDIDVYESFKRSIEINSSLTSLTKEDLSIFLDLCKNLGEMNIQGHNDMFNLVVENLNKAITGAEKNLDKNIKMYRYLGFSFGAMLSIILI